MSEERAKYTIKTDTRKPLYIGIDPGVNTGYAAWNCKRKELFRIETKTITQVLVYLLKQKEMIHLVRIEDARKRKWFGEAGREKLQGVGSIKRDCTILETFCQENNIPYEMVPPKNNKTKMSAAYFKKLTGYEERTSVHARDAAMLVFGF